MRYAEIGVLERVKQVGLYVDRDLLKKGLDYKGFREVDSQRMIDAVRECIKRIDNELVNRAAKAILQVQIDRCSPVRRREVR